ncbi:heme ABC transporter ATP-binding protein [Nibribacter ruber]|uniref:Heme ABC transporter ATP-binding protein n=1 Tax=Nibribacter ruber TaxID=2698458 RepID=A0A6P1P490_9BACT|nr:heme ABC transporter ATP-binding protein [Nibribacter ruber]QHL89146.1 heme ABC transporter ATP-binding protein [Nibribacter ruber]
MLQAENITYAIGSKTLLQDVSTTFEPGKLTLILGPNGAGKSTLVKVLCKQLKPAHGEVLLEGKNLKAYSDLELGQRRAVLSQNVDLAFPLNVWEVVMMGRYPHFSIKPSAKDEQACQEAMHYFDVWELAERNYLTLSGGEKQRVQFARVMTQIWYPVSGQNRYLIMDEPLSFLDVHYQFQFMHQVQDLLRQQPDLVVVGVVHDLNLAAKFADKIILIHGGKVLAQGSKWDVLSAANVETAYRLRPVVMADQAKDSLYLFFE